MLNFKIPIYTGISGFVIILLVNIIKGNTLFIILLRSFLYGAVVFGIFFCILFIFKKYLNLNIEADGINDFKDQEEKPNVDIVVGQEDIEENIENIENIEDNEIKEEGNNVDSFDSIDDNRENENVLVDDYNDVEQEVDSVDVSDNIPKEEITAERVVEEKLEKEGVIKDTNENIEEPNEEKQSDDNENIEQTSIEVEDDNTHELDELSLDGEDFSEDSEYKSTKVEGSTVKEKLGMDVSYEELAKAIRTKLKRDED